MRTSHQDTVKRGPAGLGRELAGGACETYCESFDTGRRVIIHLAVLSRTRAPFYTFGHERS
jgi:hypothetical protein